MLAFEHAVDGVEIVLSRNCVNWRSLDSGRDSSSAGLDGDDRAQDGRSTMTVHCRVRSELLLLLRGPNTWGDEVSGYEKPPMKSPNVSGSSQT